MGGPYLGFSPDPAVWLVGPTPDRPIAEWLPVACAAVVADFGLSEEQTPERDVVRRILASTAERHPSVLPYFLLRWRSLTEVPLPLFIGTAERDDISATERWLGIDEPAAVEPPLVEHLDTPGPCVTRSTVYSLDGEHELVIGLRYVVDTGHPTRIVLAHTAGRAPSHLLPARNDVEAFLATVRLTDEPAVLAR